MHTLLSLAVALAPLFPAAPGASPAPSAREDQGHQKPPEEHAEPSRPVFHLPFPAGRSYVCSRVPGAPVAEGEEGLSFAVDFDLPKGSDVAAAADGWVVEVKQDSEINGQGVEHVRHANVVTLDHGGGLYTRYLHLAKDSVPVAEGAWIVAGTKLGESGDTGRAAAPKLTFLAGDVWGTSQPFAFAELKAGVPAEKQRCLSKNEPGGNKEPKKAPSRFGSSKPKVEEPPPAPPPASDLPPDAFAFNGIHLEGVLPAHFYEREWTYVVSGSVDPGITRVVFFLTRRDSEASAAFFAAPVNDRGKFVLPVRLADQQDKLADGPFQYAFAKVTPQGNYASTRLLPLTLVEKKR